MTEAAPLRVIRSGALHPWLNMALDEALAPDPPVLRLYRWDPPGLSLGYFQRRGEVEARDGWVVVRRVTGGAAICHQDDVTFALVALPSFAWFQGDVAESYARVHDAIARGLARLGVAAAARGAVSLAGDAARGREAVCFHHATSFDLVAAGKKLVGSAQRRRRDRVLHHGSIPVGPNPLAGRAACLEHLLARRPPFAEIEDALCAAFAESFALVASEPSAAEWAAARELVESRFGTAAWNER